MKKLSASLSCFLLLFNGLLLAQSAVDPLPNPISNNAVAMLKVHGQMLLFSFMGIGSKKTSDAITNTAFSLETKNGTWSAIRAVPGTVGRISAVAATANNQLFLFGGYVLDAQGRGVTVPDVGLYEPARDRWYREADLPLPLGDSVAGVYHDRYIYLVSGRSNGEVVNNVQLYDAERTSGRKPRQFRVRPYSAMPARWLVTLSSISTALARIRLVAPGTLPPTNAGWARSTITIPAKFNGQSCPTILAQAGIA